MRNAGCDYIYLRQLVAYLPAARVKVGGAGHVAAGGQEEQQQLQQDAQHLVGGTAHHREQRQQQERLWAAGRRIKELYIQGPPHQQINTEQLGPYPCPQKQYVLHVLTSKQDI